VSSNHRPHPEEQPHLRAHGDHVPEAQLPAPSELARRVVLLVGTHAVVDAEGVSWLTGTCISADGSWLAGHFRRWYIIWVSYADNVGDVEADGQGLIAIFGFTGLWITSFRFVRRVAFEFFLVAHIIFTM